MKVALVHDYLNQVGGGERVLDELIKLFPEAPIYTLLYDEEKTLGRYKGKVKKTSFLDFSFARNHHRLFIPLMPLAARSLNLGSEYDLIISDSAGFGKGIRYDKKTTKHLCYVHTPLRYAWETSQYFGRSVIGRLFTVVFWPAFWYVRRFDFKAGQQPDVLIANSNYIAAKIKKYYNRTAEVVCPPVDTKKFFPDPSDVPRSTLHDTQDYYLAAGRLLHYKRFDLIIEAFAELKLPLKIVGTGQEFAALYALRSTLHADNIEFLGYVRDDSELRALYQHAKAFIMPNEEDFGLVMAEAQACGAPVIAYGAGGALEIVEEGKTGVSFNEQTPTSLINAVKHFETTKFDRVYIANHAQKFGRESFENQIKNAIIKL